MWSFVKVVCVITTVLLVGAIGLWLLTEQPFLHCLYQAFVLLSTVGSQEPNQLSDSVRLFIVGWLSVGLGIFAYSAFQFGQLLLNADLRRVWEQRRMEKAIQKLNGHFIVCGFGRMGRELCTYLHQRHQPFVVIDEDEDVITPAATRDGWLFLTGDATRDENLEKAGIHRAKALTTVLPTDADNLYVVLSARMLDSDLQIVARAVDDRAGIKMQQAGATRVINPLASGAIKMARFMLSPSIENFVEVAESEGGDWEIADVCVPEKSSLIGQPLSKTGLRESGIMLLGVSRKSGEKFFPPPGNLMLQVNDNLFAFGSTDSLSQLTSLLDE